MTEERNKRSENNYPNYGSTENRMDLPIKAFVASIRNAQAAYNKDAYDGGGLKTRQEAFVSALVTLYQERFLDNLEMTRKPVMTMKENLNILMREIVHPAMKAEPNSEFLSAVLNESCTNLLERLEEREKLQSVQSKSAPSPSPNR